MEYQLSLSLGTTLIQHPHGELEALQEIFGHFIRVTFQLKRTSTTAYELKIQHRRSDRGTGLDYEEEVGGLIGDQHQLLYKRRLTFVRSDEDGGLTIAIEASK